MGTRVLWVLGWLEGLTGFSLGGVEVKLEMGGSGRALRDYPLMT
jgi:hypothetical protein